MQTKPDEDAHKRSTPGKRLIILSDAEKRALYGLPEFDDFQRIEFFAMTDAERTTALQRKGLEEQIYCLLQIVGPSRNPRKFRHSNAHFSLQDS